MKRQLKLEISNPCQENYNGFKKTTNGGFCNSCSREVLDFTKKDISEIHDYFSNNSENTCVRLTTRQLNIINSRPRLNFIRSVGIACLALFSFGEVLAQEKPITSETKVTKQENTFTIKGNVQDGDFPLPGVNIILQGSRIGTQSDINGDFIFPKKLKIGDVLIFSYVGMKSQKVVVNSESSAENISLKLDMELDQVILMGKVSTKKVYRSNRY